MWLCWWTEKPCCVVCSYLPRRFVCCLLAGQVLLLSVFVICSKDVQIYVFPDKPSNLADSPVDATPGMFIVKSYSPEKFRYSRIMVDGERKVCRRAPIATVQAIRSILKVFQLVRIPRIQKCTILLCIKVMIFAQGTKLLSTKM